MTPRPRNSRRRRSWRSVAIIAVGAASMLGALHPAGGAVAHSSAWRTGQLVGVMNAEFNHLRGVATHPRLDCTAIIAANHGQKFNGCVSGERQASADFD